MSEGVKMNALAPMVPLDLEIFERAEAIAGKLARSSLLPSALRGKPADLAVIMVTGQELGLSPMQALRGLHVVEGRPVLAAELIVGLVKRHPACRYFRLVKSDDQVAIYETQREGEPEPTRLSWTIQQAQKAGLGGRHNWKAHPAAMLRARCSAALARAVYPDVAMGIYDPDEAQDIREGITIEGQTVIPPPQKAKKAAPKNGVAEPEDAEIVERAAEAADEEASAPEVDEDIDETDPADEWRERIEATQSAKELQQVGAELSKAFPDKDSPVRVFLRDVYSAQQARLRNGGEA